MTVKEHTVGTQKFSEMIFCSWILERTKNLCSSEEVKSGVSNNPNWQLGCTIEFVRILSKFKYWKLLLLCSKAANNLISWVIASRTKSRKNVGYTGWTLIRMKHQIFWKFSKFSQNLSLGNRFVRLTIRFSVCLTNTFVNRTQAWFRWPKIMMFWMNPNFSLRIVFNAV